MLNPDTAPRAAANVVACVGSASLFEKTINLIIAAFCIENGHILLQDDESYAPMQTHFGLRTVT